MDNNKHTQRQAAAGAQETPDATLIDIIVSEKRIQGAWLLTELFALFDALTQHDTQIEKKKAPLQKRYRLFFGAAIPTYLLVGVIGWKLTENPMSGVWAAIPAGLLLLGAILQVLLDVRYQQYDVTNDFRDYVRPALEALQQEIEPNSRVDIDLYLSPVFRKEFRVGKGERYKADGYTCRDHVFERDLVSMTCRLSDGNQTIVNVHEVLIKTYRSRWERYLGRIWRKTNVQYQRHISCTITLAVDSEKFACKELPTREDRRIYMEQRNGGFILSLTYMEEFNKNSREKSLEGTLQEELKNNRPGYEINQQTLHNLRAHGLPPEILEKLGQMNDYGEPDPNRFVSVLQIAIGAENMEQYRELILKQSERYFHPDPERIVQGLMTLYTFVQPKNTPTL